MNIAVVTVELNTHSGSRAPIELALALVKLNHQVTIFAREKNIQSKVLKKLAKGKVRLELIPAGIWEAFDVAKRLKIRHFDVISFHASPLFFFGAKLTRLPIVRTYYGTQFDAIRDKFFPATNVLIKVSNMLGNVYVSMVEYFILTHSNKIVGISKYARDEVEKLYNIKADYCYLGLPSQITSTHSKEFSRKTRALTLLSVSRLVPYKGFHRLIFIVNDLVKRYPHLKLKIAGRVTNHHYYDYLKSLKQSHIYFLPNISDKQLTTLYRTSDIYVTCDRFLFFGLPLLEAQATGLPVVAFNTCAAPEIIKNGQTGYLVKSLAEFSDLLARLLDSPVLRSTMGRLAKKLARQFTWEKTAQAYEKIFSSVVA